VVWRAFRTLRFDNLTSAVKKILRGHQRKRLRASSLSAPLGLSGGVLHAREGHEKAASRRRRQFRRNHLVPVPRVRNLEELNRLLESGADQEAGRLITVAARRLAH